jgi:WhiB family transcriptional regulator, redox-sensing transcriptional regulator
MALGVKRFSLGKVLVKPLFKRKSPLRIYFPRLALTPKFPTTQRNTSRMNMQWLNESRCLTEDPELFFPVGNTGPAVDQIEQAKSVCRECGVATQCLEYAIKENQDTGVWGGLSEDERKSLKRKYARARRAG